MLGCCHAAEQPVTGSEDSRPLGFLLVLEPIEKLFAGGGNEYRHNSQAGANRFANQLWSFQPEEIAQVGFLSFQSLPKALQPGVVRTGDAGDRKLRTGVLHRSGQRPRAAAHRLRLTKALPWVKAGLGSPGRFRASIARAGFAVLMLRGN